MNLSWSVLALALIGAEGQQPSQPKTPSSPITIEIDISGPDDGRERVLPQGRDGDGRSARCQHGEGGGPEVRRGGEAGGLLHRALRGPGRR